MLDTNEEYCNKDADHHVRWKIEPEVHKDHWFDEMVSDNDTRRINTDTEGISASPGGRGLAGLRYSLS